jgi:hypothetical protein
VDPLKIGQVAGVQKAFSVFSKKKKEKKGEKEEEEEEIEKGEARRKWLQVMMTRPDGWRYSLTHWWRESGFRSAKIFPFENIL